MLWPDNDTLWNNEHKSCSKIHIQQIKSVFFKYLVHVWERTGLHYHSAWIWFDFGVIQSPCIIRRDHESPKAAITIQRWFQWELWRVLMCCTKCITVAPFWLNIDSTLLALNWRCALLWDVPVTILNRLTCLAIHVGTLSVLMVVWVNRSEYWTFEIEFIWYTSMYVCTCIW